LKASNDPPIQDCGFFRRLGLAHIHNGEHAKIALDRFLTIGYMSSMLTKEQI